MNLNNHDVILAVENNVPVVVGKCPKCERGDRSMILLDYVHNKRDTTASMLYIQCMCCSSIYQTKVTHVAK